MKDQVMTHWRVHIGAHKTGTTHLQALLEAHRSELAAKQIDVLAFDRIGRLIKSEKRRIGVGPQLKEASEASPDLSAKIAALRSGQPTAIISHEDQLGFTQDLLDTVFYRDSWRFRVLHHLPDRESLVLFLSIRNYASLYASAFAEIVKAFPDARLRFDDFRKKFLGAPPQWSHLVESIRAAFPDTRLNVWTFEDHIKQPRFALEVITGASIEGYADISPPSSTRSPSRRAIELAEAVDPTLPFRERHRLVMEIYLKHPKEHGEDLGLFSPEEQADLERSYLEDLDRIAQIDGVQLLRPITSEPTTT